MNSFSDYKTSLNQLISRWRQTASNIMRNTWLKQSLVLFLITRCAWVLVGSFARQTFLPNPTYAHFIERGGFLSRFFLVDMFAHWDSKHYLSIIQHGYQPSDSLSQQYSNLAFFPLYPYLVKSVGWLGINLPDSAYLVIGIVLSNILFLAATGLLWRIAICHLGMDEKSGLRAIALLYAFPTSFYFGSFYTESLFLFLALAAVTMGLEKRWLWASAAAALALVTRAQGIVVLFAVGWLYMSGRRWRVQEIGHDVLWLIFSPVLLAGHLLYAYSLTGDFLAPVTAMQAWGRSGSGILEGWWVNVSGPGLDVFKIDAGLAVLFLGWGIYLLFSQKVRIWGILSILLVLMPISSGIVVSAARYLVINFPVFLSAGKVLEKPAVYEGVFLICFALQMVYFAGWMNYYWIA